MLSCALFNFAECGYGDFEKVGWTTDQFGNDYQPLYGRMLGPRYPHKWSHAPCEDYGTFWDLHPRTG